MIDAKNGWKRLYIVVFWLGALLLLFPAVFSYPARPADGEYPVYDCNLDSIYVAPRDAAFILGYGAIPKDRLASWAPDNAITSDCRAKLRSIANGSMHWQLVKEWLHNCTVGAALYIALMLLLGLLGRAAGWVWRGFFPKRPQSP